MGTWTEDKAELDRMYAEYWAKREALDEESQALWAMREALNARRLAEVTDQDILDGDEALKTWFLNTAEYDRAAADRLKVIGKLGHPYEWSLGPSWDNRPEVVEQAGRMWSFLAPVLALPRQHDAAGLDGLAAALHTWWATWAMGRTSTPLRIMEYTLSAGSSVNAVWYPDENRVVMTRNSYETDHEGTLAEMLRYIGAHHYRPGDEDRCDCEEYGQYCYH